MFFCADHHVTVGNGDVVAWSASRGLFGDVLTVGINDIRFNQRMTDACYGRALWPQGIAAGTVSNPPAEPLQQTLGNASTVAR